MPLFYFTDTKANQRLLSFYEKPYYIVKNEMMEIINSYQSGCQSVPIVFGRKNMDKVKLFHFYQPLEIDCLHETTEFYPSLTLKKLILGREKIGFNKVFTIAGILERYMIIDLEIAELFFSSKMNDFILEEVESV